MASDFLIKPLNELFAGKRTEKRQPTTKVVAIFNGVEQDVTKDGRGLWGFTLDGERYLNSKLGDLIHQIEGFGGSVERRAA